MPATLDSLRARLRDDHEFYAAHCLKITDKAGAVIPFVYKRPQSELAKALEAQRAEGKPMRALICKARQIGFSTQGQGMLFQRATTRANHNALTVAHEGKTSAELFKKVELMHANLPIDPTLAIKPTIRNQRSGQTLVFGQPSVEARRRGDLGLNSSFSVQSAKEVEAGRGFTVHSLWLSEAAFYGETRKKIALINAVPDHPDTLIVQESTANGFNEFREEWVRAVEGSSDYYAYFSAWMDEPTYSRRFASEEERAEFIEQIGEGPWGEEEPELVELYGVTPEQLNWRRWSIENKNSGDLRMFWQEFPSNWQQAFLATGQGVFSAVTLDRLLSHTEEVTDPPRPSEAVPGPDRGKLDPREIQHRRLRHAIVDVAKSAVWLPRERAGLDKWAPQWRVWEHPFRPDELPDDDERKWTKDDYDRRILAPDGRYVVGCDPMSGELTESGDQAFHAIQVINHRTREQVAEYHSRVDPDLLALEVYYAALYWNKALVAIEITGGYGLSIKNKLARDFNYPFIYRRKPRESRFEFKEKKDYYGWDTNAATIVELRDMARQILRTMPEVIRSRELVLEMTTYRQDERGRMGPEDGKFSDLYMAWAIAQQVAQESHIRVERHATSAVSTTGGKRVVSRKAGY